MTVEGAPVDRPPPLTLIMHKPLGVVCSHREPGRSIYSHLPPRWTRRDPAISSVGRLDKETSGLLLLTDDGGLLLALGRLCRRASIWGAAQRYLQQSLSSMPGPAAWRELALMYESTERAAEAAQAWREAASA